MWQLLLALACGSLFQAGCLGGIQRELDLLWAPEANLNWVQNSVLVNWFGPSILKFW